MTDKRISITEANFDEKGSFCDTTSGNTYDNVDDFGREVATSAAIDRGEAADMIDAPAHGDSYGVDQRFNVIHEEQDDQGFYAPAKHGPGR